MKIALRLAALLIIAGTLSWWAASGKNTGWTKNKVLETRIDEITEIPYPVYVDRFVPGVEFLIGASAVGVLLAGLSLLPVFRRKPRAGT